MAITMAFGQVIGPPSPEMVKEKEKFGSNNS